MNNKRSYRLVFYNGCKSIFCAGRWSIHHWAGLSSDEALFLIVRYLIISNEDAFPCFNLWHILLRGIFVHKRKRSCWSTGTGFWQMLSCLVLVIQCYTSTAFVLTCNTWHHLIAHHHDLLQKHKQDNKQLAYCGKGKMDMCNVAYLTNLNLQGIPGHARIYQISRL